ncbi:MAG: rhodanese-like domain-containing protein [Pseudomonadota bacterium]
MNKFKSIALSALAALLLSSCSDEPEVTQQTEQVQPLFDTSRFISAADVLGRIESSEKQWLFDVRNKVSFAELHIESALSLPYGKFDQKTLASIEGLSLNSPIVTYCGCPHTLSGFAAEQIAQFGYTDVRVLHEGFFYWRDNGFPVSGQNAQVTTRLEFAGTLESHEQPLVNKAVFLRNVRNGQLEAAVTDTNGYFETDFHVMSFRENDEFQLYLESLDSPELGRFTASETKLNRISVSNIDQNEPIIQSALDY